MAPVTICDYNEEKDTRPNFQRGLPEGIPRKNLFSAQT